MESANHEFTWLSGRAHLSVEHEAQSHNESSQQPKSKPTPLPRHISVVSEQVPMEKTANTKPTPLPRFFRRATISSPVYDVPPSLQSSVFYVATPKTTDSDQQQKCLTTMDKSVILEFDPILQKTEANIRRSAVFYVDTPAVNTVEVPTLPIGSMVNFASNSSESHFESHNSVAESPGHIITHQDTVTSVRNSESSEDLCCNSSQSGTPGCERSSDSALSPTTDQKGSSSLSSASSTLESASSKLSSLSRSSSCGSNSLGGKMHTMDQSLLSAIPPAPSCIESAFNQQIFETEPLPQCANNTSEIGHKISTEKLKRDVDFSDISPQRLLDPPKSASSLLLEISSIPGPLLPQLPIVNVSSDIIQQPAVVSQQAVDNSKAPIPRPRCRGLTVASHASEPSLPASLSNCSLSAVPPSPCQQSLSSVALPLRVPIQVENPFYMFFEAEQSPARCFPFDKDSDSTTSDSSSDTSNEGYGPPQFPPPPPPLCDAEASPLVELSDGLIHDESESIAPQPVLGPKPSASQLQPFTNKLGNAKCQPHTSQSLKKEETSPHSKKKIPKSSFPIYHNLVDDYQLQEGVYAKINKVTVASSDIRVSTPPPLPPRGQQRPPPPRLSHYVPNVVAQMSSPKDTASFTRQSIPRNDSPSAELNFIPHHGVLFRIGRGRKDMMQKWVVLDRGSLQCYADDKMEGPQEIFYKYDLLSVAKGADAKYCNQELFYFELATRFCKDRPQIFGARYLSECDSWIERIIQAIAPPSAVLMSGRGILRAGHILLRNSVTGMWQEGWIVLREKLLEFTLKDEEVLVLDLRKIISLQFFEKDSRMSETDDDGPMFVINYPAVTLYVRTSKAFDTTKWFTRIEQATANKGSSLNEQQMTHDGVPVIVDKCLKFVSTYGMTSKGLYRQSSTNSKIAKLLENLRKDAHKVHLQPDDYSEHDVANTLKRFLRTLPDALLTKALYPQWIAAVGSLNIEHIKVLLTRLPDVNYQTLKKIIAHLYSVSEHSEQNLMTITNLAQVFGSTLLSTECDININNAHHEMELMSYLISHYPVLFGVSVEEMEKEEKFQKALKDLREAKKAQKPAGDILVGIYVYNRHWGKCLNMKLSPSMTALDICRSAVQQTRIKDTLQSLAVFEVVCNENLERPLHHSEIVLSVTLRWASWSDTDARDNYLVIKKNEVFHRVLPLARQPLSMFGELRFADIKSKSFKKFMFEFKNARLAYYKDAKISQPLGSWNVEDITWYIGAEHRRHAPTKWALTFIEQNASVKTRSKESHYFGHTICFAVEEEFHKWVATLLIGQYPNGILPKIEPVDLLQ